MKCIFCKIKVLNGNNKSSLCYNCNLALQQNNLSSIIEIYLKRNRLKNLRNQK